MAHIRHNYTNYDSLLRIGSWEDARKAVEHACLDKLVRWRAEEDDNADAMSDILREVIVISDDEDEDQEDANVSELEHRPRSQSRHDSVEIISSQAEVEAIRTEQVNYSDLDEPRDELVHEGTGSYAHSRQLQYDHRRQDRSDAHRRQVWQEARVRRHQNPAAADATSGGHTLQERPIAGSHLDKAGQHPGIWSSVSRQSPHNRNIKCSPQTNHWEMSGLNTSYVLANSRLTAVLLRIIHARRISNSVW